MSKDKKNKAIKWLAIDNRTNLEVDHFITTNKLQEN